ncbi:peroxidase 64-like [Hibiscus syriacus]|uniref:peroxidase 64-like n=1 Tax=Hibiscus syriacus TaxID=106335 RepID=UPI00192420DD|nr:peroxidase 64-like [Hibiscus syriacus]
MPLFVAVLTLVVLVLPSSSPAIALSLNHYEKTCPDVESIVAKAVKSATVKDKTVPAALLRMHFHDCFIRGCDASVLLYSKGNNKAEKDGPANLSLHAFYVVENAKKEVEAQCPGVVSCADILAFAARDAVVLSGGPTWDVPKGRKDGRTSKASETIQLPAPTFNISQLQQSFSQRGLSMDDLVALSGGFQEFKLLERLGEGSQPTAIIGEVADDMNLDLEVMSMEAIHSKHVDANLLAEFVPCPVLLLPL